MAMIDLKRLQAADATARAVRNGTTAGSGGKVVVNTGSSGSKSGGASSVLSQGKGPVATSPSTSSVVRSVSTGGGSKSSGGSSGGGQSALSALTRVDNTAGTGSYQGGITTGHDDYGKVDYSAKFVNAYNNPDTSWEDLQSIYDQRLGKLDAVGGMSEYGAYGAGDATQQAMYEKIQERKAQQQKQQQYIQAPSYEPVNDYSDFVAQMNAAAREKSLAALKAAYDKNVNAIDAARGQIAPQYEDARNRAAGQAAIDRKNWQEQAAALGLSSGVAGQAALYQNASLQSDLASLDRQESADLSQLQLQRTQTESDYNNAIAQAQASGDYELAQQLYAEKVRVDEANRAAIAQQFAQQLQAMQFNYGVSMDAQNREDTLTQQAWQNRFNEDQAAASQDSTQWNQLWNLAAAQADYGDFSGFRALGLDEAAIANMRAMWQQDRNLALQQAQAKLVSSGSGGTRTSTPKTGMTLTVAQNMAKQGQFTDEVLNTLRNAGYNDEYIMAAYGWSGPGAAATGTGGNMPTFSDIKRSLSYALQSGDDVRAAQINEQYYGLLTPQQQAEIDALARQYGY